MPAEATTISRRAPKKLRNAYSAVRLRKTFPVQTNRRHETCKGLKKIYGSSGVRNKKYDVVKLPCNPRLTDLDSGPVPNIPGQYIINTKYAKAAKRA